MRAQVSAPFLAEGTQCLVQIAVMDGQTEHIMVGHLGCGMETFLDQVAVEPWLKLRPQVYMVWVRPRGPRPGLAHSSPAIPNSAVYTVEELGLGEGPGQDNRWGAD